MPSSRSTNKLAAQLPCRYAATLWTEYLRHRWARQRLTLYGGKKRVFANFFNRLIKEFSEGGQRRVVVAYGNGKFASGGVGEQSVPTVRAYKECVSRVTTYLTDEFRTSKVHYIDHSVLQFVATLSSPRMSLRGLLYNPTLRRFVSRDLNAAMNIRSLLIGPRPVIFCRQSGTGGTVQALQQEIFKRVAGR